MKPLAISIGEPAGIGPDLILRLFAQRKEESLPPFIVYGNGRFLADRARRLGLEIKITETDPEQAGRIFPQALPVVNTGDAVKDMPGTINRAGSRMALQAIKNATIDCLDKKCRALVTAPVNKAALADVGFEHPGHTEFLASLCAGNNGEIIPIMMLASRELRVVPLSIHMALARVPGYLSKKMIVEKTRNVAKGLKTGFGIAEPRIAMCGLNPHAGEEGTFGREEVEMISPAIEMLKQEGMDIEGPLPADTAFYPPKWRQYDVVVAMYHDQALIPIKTIAFDRAVNITLGLPIVRTSPDHGTAIDIAGTSKASTKSMKEAIRSADKMSPEARTASHDHA